MCFGAISRLHESGGADHRFHDGRGDQVSGNLHGAGKAGSVLSVF